MAATKATPKKKATKKRKPSAAQLAAREERKTELLDKLVEASDALRTSEGWLAHLKVARRFHHYSLRNQLLIAMQKPEATRVAGYRAWQALGRQVIKGESALFVLAPVIRKMPMDDAGNIVEPEHATRWVRRVVNFTGASVFDVSQTEGDELPPTTRELWEQKRAQVAEEHGDAEAWESVWTDVVAAVEAKLDRTVKLHAEPKGGAMGWWVPDTTVLHVVAQHPAERIKTLLHELSHSLDPDVLVDAEQAELVAESSAWLIAGELGIEATAESALYVTTWGLTAEKALAIAERVHNITSTVLAAVTTEEADTEEEGEAK